MARGNDMSFRHDVNIRLLLRSESTKHGSYLVHHYAQFPHSVDASETGHNVASHCEHKLEVVVTAFLEREAAAGGGCGQQQQQLRIKRKL